MSPSSPSSAAPALPSRQAHGTADDLAVAALLTLAVLAAVVWLTGGLSSWLSGEGWAGLAPSQLPGVVARLPGHLADPARAWPASQGGARPGPVWWWGTLALLCAPALALGLAAHRLARRPAAEGARFARPGELRPLAVRRPVPGRLVLGRAGRRLLATEDRHSLLVVGPTQSGKTTGLAVPAILEWDGPVVATSVKADLLADTLAWRQGRGDTWVYDPTGATRLPRSTWSPVAACRTWTAARRTASDLADASRVSAGGIENADFWFAAGAKLLAPFLLAAAIRGLGAADVVRWVDTQDRVEARAVLATAGCQAALDAHDATWTRDERTRSSVFTTAEFILQAYADPVVAASAATSSIDAARLVDGSASTLYLVAPPADQKRLRPLFATLVGQVIQAVYAEVARTGEPLRRPLLLVLDEAANIAPVPDLATIASTAASHGLQLVTVWQDLAQLRARYGGEAGTILNNHRAKLVLPGVGDLETLDYVSELAGHEEAEATSVTTDATGRRSSTASMRSRPLLAPEALRQLRRGEGVLIYGALPPARLRLRPWYRSRRLRARAAGDVRSTASSVLTTSGGGGS